ncbi:NUDIX hydrolase [Paenibacillus paeoniae]|uniref:NUDIX domain-containing protein n=1 Tax=Paenibacillus paeoniae TaxID=2292705 RepID=A0A371PG74_9BACL|nr:NUDIX domain-containing protein [Paenibacillus paeoniae]REK74400.1 NUDIX domain-containing protein [Paenibacillus paeoniae]
MAEERFDIYDEAMNPIGTATRSDTHKHGYWHRSFHCWLTRRIEGHPYVVFQQRQLSKDTNPGSFDTTAAGHLTAGETIRDAVRELEEELGIQAEFDELVPLGQIREEAEGIVRGMTIIDREVSDVFALVCELPLAAFRLQPEEVVGVYEATIADMIRLLEGSVDELSVRGMRLNEDPATGGYRLAPDICVIRASEFVPRETTYYIDVMNQLAKLT